MTLIERLRDYINNTDDCGLRVEAADELERQERRIKELEAELRNASIWLTDRTLVKAELAALRKRIEDAPVAAVEKIGMTTHTFIRKEDLTK